jgi:hypothetical protein
MRDFFAATATFIGILLVIALGLYLLSRWHSWIEKRFRRAKYPDLAEEAANSECGFYPVSDCFVSNEHIRHRNKFRGRHYDAA